MYGLDDLIRSYLRATHKNRLLVPVKVPGQAAGAFRAGANLTPEHAVGHLTWEQFLAERLSGPVPETTEAPRPGRGQ